METKNVENSIDLKGNFGAHPDGRTYRLTRMARLELCYRLAETLSWEGGDFMDDVRIDIGTWAEHLDLAETRKAWADSYYPEPSHLDEHLRPIGKTIDELMKLGIVFSHIDWIERLIEDAQTRQDALDMLNGYLGAHGWNQHGTDGRIASYGSEHGKDNYERCTECPTHCHD